MYFVCLNCLFGKVTSTSNTVCAPVTIHLCGIFPGPGPVASPVVCMRKPLPDIKNTAAAFGSHLSLTVNENEDGRFHEII